MLNYQYGPVNYVLGLLHLGQPTWTADPSLALPSLIFVDFWQWTPFMTLLLFAGLRSLPGSIVEAARMDGSNAWQIVWRIYLPLLRPVIGIALILRVLMAFKLFDIIYVLTAGGPGVVTENLAFFTYVQGFRYFNLGYASALAILQLIVVSLLARALIALTKRPSLSAREAAA
jgi:multiple sugar transport system permease protein